MNLGPWLAAVVSIIATMATVVVSSLTIRSQQNLAREERSATRALEETRTNSAKRAEQSGRRRSAVQSLIHQERARVAEDRWLPGQQGELERLANEVMLLTHPLESALRAALLARLLDPEPFPEWWFPWAIEWIGEPDRPHFAGKSDNGEVTFMQSPTGF